MQASSGCDEVEGELGVMLGKTLTYIPRSFFILLPLHIVHFESINLLLLLIKWTVCSYFNGFFLGSYNLLGQMKIFQSGKSP